MLPSAWGCLDTSESKEHVACASHMGWGLPTVPIVIILAKDLQNGGGGVRW